MGTCPHLQERTLWGIYCWVWKGPIPYHIIISKCPNTSQVNVMSRGKLLSSQVILKTIKLVWAWFIVFTSFLCPVIGIIQWRDFFEPMKINSKYGFACSSYYFLFILIKWLLFETMTTTDLRCKILILWSEGSMLYWDSTVYR